jgi:hypothetical protein
MVYFRTVTYIALHSPLSHPVLVRNAGGGRLTYFERVMLYRVVSGQILSLYSDMRKKNQNAMTRKCTAVATRV